MMRGTTLPNKRVLSLGGINGHPQEEEADIGISGLFGAMERTECAVEV